MLPCSRLRFRNHPHNLTAHRKLRNDLAREPSAFARIGVRPHLRRVALVLPILLAFQTASAGIVINKTMLTIGMTNPTFGGDGVITKGVVFPLSLQQSSTFQNSSAFASYLGSFDGSTLDFQASASLTCEGSPPIFSSFADGSIQFTTDMPLLLSVDATFSYNLPAGDRESSYFVRALSPGPHYYVNDGGGAQPVFGDPPINTLTAHADSVLLPANQSYTIGYEFELRSFSGSPSVDATATGDVQFILQTVPEPATALLLLTAAALPLTRRRPAGESQLG